MPNVIRRLRSGLAQGMCWGLWFAGTSLYATPDLIVNQFRLEGNVAVQTRTFAAADCAVVEGCTLAGARRLLLFDVGLVNIGDGDLVIGDPAQRPDLFHASPCHGHYHMDGVSAYELLTSNGQTVVAVRKQGFCFRDQTPAFTNAAEGKFTCDFQGLTIGWEDVYDKSLDCQWLDITGLAAGQYILRVVCNPDAVLHESNYQNNVAEVLITLGIPAQTNKPPKCINHDDWKKWWDWKKLKDKFKGHWIKKCKIPRCTCKCHKPPGKPGDGDDDDDHGGNGGGKDDDDDDHGNGGGGKDDDDDDHGGNGSGKDDDDDDHGNGGGKDDDDDDHGGNGGGKDDDDDDHGNGGGKDDDDDDHGGNGGGKDDDDDDHGGKGDGKDRDDDDDKGKGGGKGKGDGKGKGKGGKNDGKGKPAPKPKGKK